MMKRPILPADQLSSDGREVYRAINEERSDLACALILVAYLENCLGSLLKNLLIESEVPDKLLDPRSGILGSLQARTDLAYSLGLLSKQMYGNLIKIGEVRNIFAHSHLDIKFEDPRIEPVCHSLTLPPIRYQADEGESAEDKERELLAFLSTPRMKFTFASVLLADRILLTALSTKHLPRNHNDNLADGHAA